MGRIFKIKGEYFVEFYGNGLRFQKKAGRSKKEAEQKLKDIEESLSSTALKGDIQRVDVKLFLKTYEEYAAQVYSPRSLHRFILTMQHFDQFLTNLFESPLKLSLITPKVIEDYKYFLMQEAKKRTPAVKTQIINFTLYLLREIFEYAIVLGWLNDNPTLHITYLKENRSFPKIYKEQEFEGLIKNLTDSQKRVSLFILHTGLRRDELLALTWGDVDFKGNFLQVKNVHPKDIHIRSIPLDHQAQDILRGRQKQGEDLFQKSDIPDTIEYGFLRNMFAKNLLEKGVNLFALSRFLGFRDVARVYRYSVFIPKRNDLLF